MEIVNGLIKELQIIMGLELNEKNHHQPIQTIRRWYAQERGQYKINVDAAIARQGDNGAIGAICRDDHGEYVAASARCWIDPNGRPTARDSVSGGPLDPAP
jgi:isoaspartyl peptidase/L-asparaginase-like protein (Ntn-hydrolase superfamily)